MIRKYIQRRWGVRLMKLLWGPGEPTLEYSSITTKATEHVAPESFSRIRLG